MTDPVFTQHPVAGALTRKGRSLLAPPNPPTSLTATAGDGQVSLSWTASTTSDVHYVVRRVNTAEVVYNGSATSAVILGLNNGTQYSFYATSVRNVSNQASAPSNTVSATPVAVGDPDPVITTMFGYNFNNDTSYQTVSGRRAKFGNRTPCIRIYSPNTLQSTFNVSLATAVEKRCSVSYKAGGNFTQQELGSGLATATMISYLEDIPAGWTVYWTYHHEPNSSSGMEVNPTDFVNTYRQMMIAKQSASLNAGTKVFICPNFMAYQVDTSNWDDAWVPPKGTHADILTWDIYGNPGVNTGPSGSNKYGGPATGNRYDTTYPLADQRCAPMFRVTERTGYADSWGVLEVNTPLRNWDTTESGRTLWHQDMLNEFINPPMAGSVPAKIVLLWEAPSGMNWNQGFGYNDGRSIDPDWSYGSIAYTSTKANNSPVWNVWKPYMEGVPTGA